MSQVSTVVALYESPAQAKERHVLVAHGAEDEVVAASSPPQTLPWL